MAKEKKVEKKVNVDKFISRKLSVLNLKNTASAREAVARIVSKNKGGLA